MNYDKKHFLNSLIYPALLLIGMWVVKIIEVTGNVSFVQLGVLPLKAEGLIGIITAPFIHENFEHLISNSIPFFLLTLTLFYFYKGIAGRVFLLIWLIEGVCVWFSGRDAYHIGASGIVYGLASFLFFSGVIRRDSRLAAITLIIAFLYGSIVSGIFRQFFPEKTFLMKRIFGDLLQVLYLPSITESLSYKRAKYSWELEEEESKDNDDDSKEKGDVSGKPRIILMTLCLSCRKN